MPCTEYFVHGMHVSDQGSCVLVGDAWGANMLSVLGAGPCLQFKHVRQAIGTVALYSVPCGEDLAEYTSVLCPGNYLLLSNASASSLGPWRAW